MTMRLLCAALLLVACSGDKQNGQPKAPGPVVASGSAGEGKNAGPAPAKRSESIDRGPERPVFSLADNRLLAHHQYDGGLLIPAGSAGFAKYLRFSRHDMPWTPRQDRDGTPVAAMAGAKAALRVPLTAAQADGDAQLRLRIYNPKQRPQRLTVDVNGDEVAPVEVAGGWSTTTVAVPPGALRAGENDVELAAGKRAALEVAWVQVGGGPAPDELPVWFDAAAGALVLSAGHGLAWYAMVPEDGRLVADVAGDGCAVRVEARPQSGPAVSAVLSGRGGAVMLDDLAGKVARIALAADGCDVARVTNAALAVPGEAPELTDGDPPKYVVFWIMDSLRADRVRPFVDGARPEVPTFEKLAETSAVFRQAYVQGNESRVSHASMWSSLYPVRHDMIRSKDKLAEKWFTLDEAMEKADLFTSGVTGNGYVAKKWGFGNDWDQFRNHIHEKGGLRGQDIYDTAIKTIDKRSDEPWFLYIGTIDTHVAWRAKEPWASKYDPEPYKGKFKTIASGKDMGRVASGKLKISERDKEHIRALYDSNVSYQDDLLRQLLEQLDEWGIRDQTMIVITADHGDELWEDGRVGHGGSLRDTLVHVPLLVHYPPLVPGGPVAEGAEVVDILPTLADALGLEPNEHWQGQSLIPLAQGVGAGYPRMSMASKYERAHAARIGRWKLLASGGAKPELYDLADDPGETKDVVDDHPFARRFVADALWMLRTYNADWKKRRWGNAANVTAQFAADMGE